MRKALSLFVALAVIFSMATSVFASVPVESSIEPSVEIIATDIIDGNEYDLGDGKFALIDVNLILPEGTLSDKITYNTVTKKATGQGIASFTVKAALDENIFDMANSYVVATDGLGEAGYDATSNRLSYAGAFSAKDTYVGTLAPFLQYYALLKDDTLTVDSINATNFADVSVIKLTIDKYENATAPSESTAYGLESDSTKNFEITYKVGTGSVTIDPVAPVVESVAIAPETATVKGGETVTFTATVEGTDGNDAEGNVVALDKSVTWSTTAGTIVDGVFTAPDATNEAQTITVTATSVADATKTATATVTVEAVAVIPVQPPVVTIADAVKTNDAWLEANSKAGAMFWIVTVKGSSEDSEIDSVNFTLTDTDADTDNTRSQDVAVNIAGEGSMVFGAYTTFATEERLAHAMELAVTAGETTATSRAVYSDLAE